ncbi:MAG: multicopper oxidase domain-containing protein [Gammaproteobacteria bacterium]|nr:multicopper oxidase domain-containing protein [Gammaproteobacteria bacterium]
MALLAILSTTSVYAQTGDVTVNVLAADGGPLSGVRWMLEEDATHDIDPENPAPGFDSAAYQLHTSYMPIARTGSSTTPTFSITDLDASKRYYLSVIPHEATSECGSGGAGAGCYTMSGAPVRFNGETNITVDVKVQPQPLPTAQARIRVFDDRGLINNWPDPGEGGLGDFVVFIYDAGGGPLVTDACGNPLDTTYAPGGTCDDVLELGDGTLRTLNESEVGDPLRNPLGLAVGELQIQHLPPAKYGIRVVSPPGQGWQQTTTIEGTQGIDVWLRAGEPTFAVEFGPTLTQAFFGQVKPFSNLTGSYTVTGEAVNLRMQRPPNGEFLSGDPLGNCWVGLNDSATGKGLFVSPCDDGGSTFTIPNVPDGTFQIVLWDTYLLNIIGFSTVIVNGGDIDVGPVAQPRWFHNHEHNVFNDLNGNGMWDDGEPGLPEQAINLRFRDGSVYFASATDLDGYLPLEEVFPFFSFLVAEADFARFKATGVTITVDEGGPIMEGFPGDGLRNPQDQDPTTPGNQMQRIETTDPTACATVDPNVAVCEYVEAPPLIEAYNGFAGNNNRFDWAKQTYGLRTDGSGLYENGGVSGVIYYQTTRAENDPRFAAPEPWEPGVPRVPVMLYDADPNGVIEDTNGVPGIQLADLDYYPFGWSEGGAMGPEDVERSGSDGVWDMGDAIDYASTDSWDDNKPDGCLHDTLMPTDADPSNDDRCYDSLRNWSQVRPSVFDGGFGLGAPWNPDLPLAPGKYVVEAAAPAGYEHQDELSKNVDFGDTFMPQQLPPVCVGDPDHTGGQQPWNVVPDNAQLELFGGVDVDARYTGNRPYCNFKVVHVKDKLNAAADFFLYTEVPISGHIQGNVLNDINNATRANDPNFGEKIAAANIPISIRDFAGNEINRVYTDANGRYNALLASTYTINAPMPTGVSPNMVRICLNPPDDPFHDPRVSQNCYTFNFGPGTTTYLDTPVLPVGAFVDLPEWQLDCNYPDGTPVIREVGAGGPVFDIDTGGSITVMSEGTTAVVADPTMPRPTTTTRDFGFGSGGEAWLVHANGSRTALTTSAWSADSLTVLIPAGTQSGTLEVIRSDSGLRSQHGITLIAMADPSTAITVGTVGDGSIQAAIDAAPAGGVVLVPPSTNPLGFYTEALIITKPIQLQGYGAGSTIINSGRAADQQLLIDWRENANQRVNCPASPDQAIGLLPGQRNNVEGFTTPANCGFRPATGLFADREMAGVLVAPVAGAFGSDVARIDGLTFTSSDYSGGIIVNGNATGLEISNNIVRNNQGLSAGGIQVGVANLYDENREVVDGNNDNVRIHHNYVTQNSSTFENGGGLGIYSGADNYRVSSNYICGNFSQGDGAGMAHYGRSPGGLIENNQFLFNQSFDQTAAKRGGNGGGIFVSGALQDGGAATPLTGGSGPVTIIGNNLQGNMSGSGDGSAIALQSINGQDMFVTVPDNREAIRILNNTITNNVAGYAGAISMHDAVNVSIIHNTIVNNDSTATVAAAIGADPNQTIPQPAGIVSRAHSADLLALNAADAGAYSNATINNNIILGNRSMYWQSGVGLISDPPAFWDLSVEGVGGSLNPQGNILSSEDARNAGYGGNTLFSVADEDSLLDTPYVNGQTGTLLPFDVSQFATPPLAAAAQDEGGNFLTAVYGPLSDVGDYHLESGSAAIDVALTENMLGISGLFSDIDGDPRPVYTLSAMRPDMGADEADADPSPPELPPEIISMPSLSAQIGLPYAYQVLAVDANQVGGFTYQVQRCNGGYTNCGMTLLGASIDINGVFSWTPPNGQVRNWRVTVCDSTARCDAQDFRLSPYSSNPPIARDDPNPSGNGFIEVNVMGQFNWPAPGVLRNDSTGNGNQPEKLTPMIGNTSAVTTAGGTVSLFPNGSFRLAMPAGWTGTTSFQYTVTDGVDPSPSAPATVSARRRVIINNATFTDSPGTTNDSWSITGYGGNFGGPTNGNMQVSVYLIPPVGGEGAQIPVFIGASNPFSRAGSAWTVNATGVTPSADGTLTVRLGNNDPAGAILLQGVVPSVLYSGAGAVSNTTVFVQCPGDTSGQGLGVSTDPAIWCKHLTAGDGFISLADGGEMYTFGFSDATGIPAVDAIANGLLDANFPAPTLVFEQGHEAYLTLSNAGTILRPDLFDPHTVHFHGFPNASAVFDGVPESSISINAGFSLTYYYNIVDPGTFMYHCHVEASEHMQMGMLGNLYVHPAQNGTTIGGFDTFVYNDGDGSTGYDIEVPIQIGGMDKNYHDEHLLVQPLPFAYMHDDYPMLNGRGYPDTILAGPLPAPASKGDAGVLSGTESSQKVSSVVTANVGDRILLRISNLNVTQFNTLATNGLPMRVVGMGAHILRGPGNDDLYYETNSVTLGGGEAVDVLIDTADVAPGTYVLYTTNLNDLSNGAEDFGGMMTEIVINP